MKWYNLIIFYQFIRTGGSKVLPATTDTAKLCSMGAISKYWTADTESTVYP
jgi:hypothetical protein